MLIPCEVCECIVIRGQGNNVRIRSVNVVVAKAIDISHALLGNILSLNTNFADLLAVASPNHSRIAEGEHRRFVNDPCWSESTTEKSL